MSDFLVERQGDILVLTFNRPDRLNALSQEIRDRLVQELEAQTAAPNVRAIVLTGAGRGFCSGADLDLSTILDRRAGIEGSVITQANRMIRAIRDVPVPVVACVNGVAAGVGFSIAMACDIVVADTRASFALTFTRIGAAPDGGALTWLSRKIGEGRATAIAMLGEAISAEDALSSGLIYRLSDTPMDAAMEIAGKLAVGPTTSYAMIKRQMNMVGHSSLEDMLRLEADCQRRAFNSQDFEEGVRAFGAKRKPVFKGQ